MFKKQKEKQKNPRIYFHKKVKPQKDTFWHYRITNKETNRSGYNLFLKKLWKTMKNRLYNNAKEHCQKPLVFFKFCLVEAV